tara:strand:- start:1316 stop:2431 length:1116 start_codon:yes stop_codon:yes gene_type:complete
MSSIVYHRAEVENSKDFYTEYDDLVFFLNADGRALMKNSVRLECEVRVLKDNAGTDIRIVDGDKVFMDNSVGLHCLIDNSNIEFQSSGSVEQINEYSRMVKMMEIATRDVNDYHSGLDICEFKTPLEETTQALLFGSKSSATGATDALDFIDNDGSFKPKFCLNKMSDDMSFSKTGYVKVSLNLAKVANVLYGKDVSSTNKYQLRNVRMCFKSVPDVSNNIQMRTMINLKSTISSTLSNSQARVPSVCDGVSCCFMEASKENVFKDCSTSMDVLTGINSVQFLFNDSSSNYISWVLDNNAEILANFVKSIADTGHNQVNSNNDENNYGIGLSFPPTDLSNQKFNIQINSNHANISTNPYIIYMYFHSFISL